MPRVVRVPQQNNMNNQHNNNPKHFSIPIQPFAGDPAVLDFFAKQIQDVCTINNYENNQAVAFFRAHLTGAALNFYCTDPYFKGNLTLQQIIDKFKEYFLVTPNASVHTLQTLQILPSESMHNLAHRLNKIIAQVYPELVDEAARNTIKLTHFTAALPYSIKVVLLKENIVDFNEAVKRAQQLQDIEISAAMVPTHPSDIKIASLNEEVNALKQQINAISLQKSEQNKTKQDHREYRNAYKTRFSRKPYDRNFGNKQNYYKPKFNNFSRTTTCSFCGRNNHIMKNCREFLSLMKNSDKNQTYPKLPQSRRHDNQYNDRSFPNVDAESFRPGNLNL